MKKIALALLSLFLTTPCLANIHINPSTVESVVKEFVPADKMVSVISEYNNQLKQSNGTGISAQKLWNICAIAGWDIKQPSGKSQCQKFVNALVEKSSIKFYHACDKQYKGKAGYICVDDFFTNKIYGGTQVNLTPGQTLAKEYARLKHNDSTVQCRNKFDPGTLDDTLMCTSHNKNAYYEFVFDDLEEPKDQTIKNSIQNAICRMYDAKPTTAGCAGGGTNVSGTATCWSASCAADSAKCAKINQSMAKFGYSAIYKDNKCEINFNSINDKSKLKTAYGIDNFVFCHGIQVANAPNVETYLKQYIAERAGVSASSVKCESGFNTYTGDGCARNGITDFKDDIKTCRVGNNQIDFVFDDINEKWKKTVEGGVQGMSCIVTGGTYSGERCIGLGEQQCNTLRQSNLKECPECKAAKWDKETQSCLLPSSKSAQNLQKGVNISLIVGGAVVGVALTVVTAGAAGAPVTAIVLTGIETVGAGIELTSQLKINGIADDFLVESNKCKNATCAKKMLSQNLQRMANYANDMTAAEADAVDTEMARLANLIPDDDEIWATMLVNGTDMADNKLGFFDTDSWEPEQVWRAVGIGLQLAPLITGITKWAISKSSRVVKSTAAIKQKFARAIQSIDNAPESTLRAKRLALKQQLERDALKKRIAQGKIVHNADDILLTPEMTKLAAPIDETLELHDMRLIDQEFSRIDANHALSATEKDTAKKEVLRGLMYSDQGSSRFLESTMTYRQAMAESLAEDPQLFQYMDNFETLSDAQKQDFANKLVKKIESKLCDGTSCSNVYVGNFQMGADGNLRFSSTPTNVGVRGSTDGGNIYINATGKSPNPYAPEQGIVDNTKVEGFLSSLTHEHDHAIGNVNPGTAGISQTATEFAESFHVGGETNLDNLLEQSAYTKEYSVSSGIVDEVKDLRHSSPQPAPIRHTASATTNTPSVLQSAKNKLYTYGTDFDKVVDDFLRNDGGYPAWWKMSDLTPAEHNALQSFLNEKGITLTTETQELNGVKETFYRLKK